MASIVRVPVADFTPERLDTGYYSEEFYAAKKEVIEAGLTLEPIGSVCEPWQFGAYALCNEIVWAERAGGIPFIKAEAIESPLIDVDALSFITPATHALLSKSALSAGDIIVSTSGTVGRLAVLPDTIPAANSNQDTIKFSLRGTEYDSHFVAAWLTSACSQAFMNREAGGAVQQHIYLYNFKRLPLLKLQASAQRYIGEKVRQAERLKLWARKLKRFVNDEIDRLALPIKAVPSQINRVSARLLDARLDPRPYRTHYLQLVTTIEGLSNDRVSEIANLSSGCPVSSDDFVPQGPIPLVRIRNIGVDEFIDLDVGVARSVFDSEARFQAKAGLVVLGMDGIFRAQFFLEDELPMLINQRVALLSPSGMRGELLTHWLNRPEGQMQLNQWAVKTTVEHTSLPDIGRVRIPRLDRVIEDELADKLNNARLANRYARFLTIGARQFIEGLIGKRIKPTDLSEAQEQLDSGDNTLDRLLMGRMTRDGIDGPGQPLFPELDQLYDLVVRSVKE
jgi:type I restriction enzyme S subunit